MGSVDPPLIALGIGAASVFTAALIALARFVVQRTDAAATKVDDAVGEVMDHLKAHIADEQATLGDFRSIAESLRTRVERVEATQALMPSTATVHALALNIAGLAGDMKSHSARLDGVVSLISRMEIVTSRLELWVKEMPRG